MFFYILKEVHPWNDRHAYFFMSFLSAPSADIQYISTARAVFDNHLWDTDLIVQVKDALNTATYIGTHYAMNPEKTASYVFSCCILFLEIIQRTRGLRESKMITFNSHIKKRVLWKHRISHIRNCCEAEPMLVETMPVSTSQYPELFQSHFEILMSCPHSREGRI